MKGLSSSLSSFLMLISLFSFSTYQKFSLSTQILQAGAIISGKVHKITNNTIILKKTQFLKGCGPRTIALTLPDNNIKYTFKLPKIGQKVIILGCQDSLNRRWWTINDYWFRKQGVYIDVKYLPEIKHFLEKHGICRDCCSFLTKCQGLNGVDMDNNFWEYQLNERFAKSI